MKRQAKIEFFSFISSLIRAKTGICYLDLEPGNKFWNRFLLQITKKRRLWVATHEWQTNRTQRP